jgi:hypothetical protein
MRLCCPQLEKGQPWGKLVIWLIPDCTPVRSCWVTLQGCLRSICIHRHNSGYCCIVPIIAERHLELGLAFPRESRVGMIEHYLVHNLVLISFNNSRLVYIRRRISCCFSGSLQSLFCVDSSVVERCRRQLPEICLRLIKHWGKSLSSALSSTPGSSALTSWYRASSSFSRSPWKSVSSSRTLSVHSYGSFR